MLQALARSEMHADVVMGTLDFDPAIRNQLWIDYLYEQVLGRPPDPVGAGDCRAQLEAGRDRRDLARYIIASDEHVNRATAAAWDLPNLRMKSPERYLELHTSDGNDLLLLRCSRPQDFDWIEARIIGNSYYDKPGVWSFLPSRDKEVMAELISALGPTTVLEIGCSNGTILSCLSDAGVWAEGVDISEAAVARAEPRIRPRIHIGDVLGLDLAQRYDVVFGLDIFEHLNPNRLTSYLAKLSSLIVPGGFLYANIPVYGSDAVFGCAFDKSLLAAWEKDSDSKRPFSLLPVDLQGYPVHGHLILADTDWWVSQFEQSGLTRERELELALHERYDEFWAQTGPGRRLFYLFSRERDALDNELLTQKIRGNRSRVLTLPAP